MEKFKNVMTVITFIVTAVVAWVFFDLMSTFASSNDGWVLIGVLIMGIVIGIATVILTIPFFIVLSKVKYANMKLYFYAHIALVVLTISFIATAFLLL